MRAILSLLLGFGLAACATSRDRASLDPRDPYEGFNRGVWGFNQAVDKVAIKPAAVVYRTVTPIPARRGIANVFRNLTEPFSAINALLQGKPKRFANSIGRFLINSTIGVGGLADHATGMGLVRTREDFGQTLAVAGAHKSPYLVLPILGPSTIRDAIGTGVEFVADPVRIVLNSQLDSTASTIVTGARLIDARSQAIENGTDTNLANSADPYAAARSAYFQSREAQIADQDGAAPTNPSPQEDQDLLDKALKDAQPTSPNAAPPSPEPTTPTPGADSAPPRLESAALAEDDSLAGGH